MKKTIYIFLNFALLFAMSTASAEKLSVLALYYDELEEGAGMQSMRYLINDEFLRIDNGDDKADFILFDVKKKQIFSINHEDQTILKISNKPWKQPKFKFKTSVSEALISNAPKIHNKPVYNYQAKARGVVCTDVFFIKDTHPEKMNIFYQYQQVLSGQQVATLKNTPEDLRTPCFLLDQVYHAGDYYHSGLPVQITYSRGYAKLLKDFKEQKIATGLFKLPQNYSEYKAFAD